MIEATVEVVIYRLTLNTYLTTSKLLRHALGEYGGSNFDGLQTLGYTGYTNLYLVKKVDKLSEIDQILVNQLFDIDLENGGEANEIILKSWKKLLAINNGQFLDELQDRYLAIEDKANNLIGKQLIKKCERKTYKQLRSSGYVGFSDYFLNLSTFKHYGRFREPYTKQTKLLTLKKLVTIDMEKGTTAPELVYSCCFYEPILCFLKMIVAQAREKESDDFSLKQLIDDILSFQTEDRTNCLLAIAKITRQDYVNYLGGTISLYQQEQKCIVYLIYSAYEQKIHQIVGQILFQRQFTEI